MLTKGLVFDQERTFVSPDKLYDMSRYKHTVVDTAITYVKLSSGLYVASLDGASSKITLGNIAKYIKSVALWIYPDDNISRSIIDFDGGTISIEMDGSGDLTATGWTAPTRYVNAVIANALTQSVWNFIAVTSTTAVLCSDLVIGQEASFYDGNLILCKMWDYVLTASQIFALFQSERSLFGV